MTQPGPVAKTATLGPSAGNLTHNPANLEKCFSSSTPKAVAESIGRILYSKAQPGPVVKNATLGPLAGNLNRYSAYVGRQRPSCRLGVGSNLLNSKVLL